MTRALVAAVLGLCLGLALTSHADPIPGLSKGSCTLASGTPSTCTVTVPALSICVATNTTTQANPVKVSLSSVTLTITGPNTVTDVVNYVCF